MMHATVWVEVCRPEDPVTAEVTLNFLRDHGIDAALRGRTGAIAALDGLTGGADIRIEVRAEDVARAHEALRAMFAPDESLASRAPESADEGTAGGPYRAALARAEHHEPPHHRRRLLSGAIVLATVFPGGAHFYARHNRAGLVFCASSISCIAAGLATGANWLVLGALCCMVVDGLLGLLAVRRYNARRVPSDARQTVGASVAVGLCLLTGFVLGATRGGPFAPGAAGQTAASR